jgi:hypothetical protein
VNGHGDSLWMSAWAVFLLGATIWLMLDPGTANRMIDSAIHDFDFNSVFGMAFVAVGLVNVCALAVRIFTWNKE